MSHWTNSKVRHLSIAKQLAFLAIALAVAKEAFPQ
jgi:hypothetical protein